MRVRLPPAAVPAPVVAITVLADGGRAEEPPDAGMDPGRGREGRSHEAGLREDASAAFLTDTPDHAGSSVLGRPTAKSATVSVLLHTDGQAYIAWGADKDRLASRSGPFSSHIPPLSASSARSASPQRQRLRGVRSPR